MTVLSPIAIAGLMSDSAAKHNKKLSLFTQALGVSIVTAESGGKTDAVGVDPNDLGMWQINKKAHPEAATIAFDPVAATDWVYNATNGFSFAGMRKLFVTGKGAPSKGFLATNVTAAAVKLGGNAEDVNKDYVNVIAGGAGDSVVTGDTSTIGTGIAAVGSAVTPDWATGLARLLSNLLNGEWWKRIGVGAVGVLIVVVAAVLLFGKDAENLNPVKAVS